MSLVTLVKLKKWKLFHSVCYSWNIQFFSGRSSELIVMDRYDRNLLLATEETMAAIVHEMTLILPI